MKKVDISLLILFPILAFLITIFCKTNLFTSVFLFFGVSSVYLIIRNKKIFLKSFYFSFLLSIPLSLFFDTLAALDKSWIVPHSIFPFRFFGLATVEVYTLGFLWVLLTVLFYEHFLEKTKKEKIVDRGMRYLHIICAVLTLIVLIAWLFNSVEMLTVPYIYFWFSVILTCLLVIFLYFYPKLLQKFILAGIYFFFVTFLLEIAALHNGQWIFPGTHYIGFVEIFKYKFPIEEFVFWMMLCTPIVLAFYEFFDDDRK